jgi:hypothetical protein
MKFPDTLNDIPLKNYQAFSLIEEPSIEDYIKCLLGINETQLKKLKSNQVDTIELHLNNLLSETPRFKQTFKLNGTTFGFIPNLDDITYGENKDLTTYVNDYATMHKAMAVAYRPIIQKQGSKYRIEEYEGSHKYSELMKDAPLDVVMGMLVFFYNLTSDLLKAIPNYLQKVATQEMKTGNLSVENGEVIAKYTHLLKATLEDLMRLQKQDYILA